MRDRRRRHARGIRGGDRRLVVGEAAGHVLQCHRKKVDNHAYPRYPAEIMVMGEWLNTLAHTIIQCQRHSH